MSINGHAHADLYRERTSRDTEGGETTPLLGNGSVQTRATGASFTSSVFNLMNAIMGSGILGLAYAMASTGIVGFSILLVLVSSLALYSIHLLLKLCDQTGINSYEDLGGKALHKPGKVLVGIAILIQNIGDGPSPRTTESRGDCSSAVISGMAEWITAVPSGMSSYLFILKSELPAAINSFLSPEDTGNAWYDDGKLLLILVTVCIVLPLSMSPKIGFLSYTSSLAFLFMLYFAVVVVVKKWSIPCPLPHNVTTLSGTFKISNFSESECTPKLFVISIKSAYAIPTMAFSFLCHTAVLPIYCELERPTKARMQKVSNISIGLSFLLYFISALFGYLTFYNHVDSELLLGYDAYLPRDIMVMTVRLAVLIAVLLTVPLIHFPARKAAILLLFGGRSFSWLIHIISTLTILSVVLILAIFVPDISNVFGVVGSTMSSCLLFVFPGIFYLKISGQPLRSVDSIGAILLVVFGLIMGVMSLCVIIVTWVKSS
ncbi:putative sodium-coupled neutral amino acid transporter 6 isoform 1-T1 [Odontesthes bonariensis]|uniref:putative sodium-coupled neutral amino acid transporter 6 isoform X1 n=1 Tax=Odontesthes bonariensis TaxID=219752 RepID=UPI003F589267